MARVIVVDSGEQIRRKRPWGLWLLLSPALILIVASFGFVWWASSTNPVMPEAYNALESSDSVTVNTESWISFMPHDAPSTGLILYPGGKVLAEAYAPLARRIAEEGYLVVITYAPLNLASINPNAADSVIAHFSAVEHWAVGGHSLGGLTAAIYAKSHLEIVNGLIFMASFPADNALADAEMDVLSIFGSNDKLAIPESIEANRALLPADTQYIEIQGGNHAQFGYYGLQDGDGTATISHDEQTRQTAQAIVAFLGRLRQ
jgi:dienelactone hydrolase